MCIDFDHMCINFIQRSRRVRARVCAVKRRKKRSYTHKRVNRSKSLAFNELLTALSCPCACFIPCKLLIVNVLRLYK